MKNNEFYRPPIIDIFGIHKQPAFVHLPDGSYKPFKPPIPKFFLPNQDKITDKGKILKSGTEKQYIQAFCILLIVGKTIELEDYLDFHFEASINKPRFLKLVRALCFSDLDKYPGKQQLAFKWLDRKENEASIIKTAKGSSKEPIQNSFKYNSKLQKDNIESWLGSLIKARLISNSTKRTDFKKIFSEVPLSKITPIDWIGSIASFKYFLKCLKFDLKEVEKIEIATDCFTHKESQLNISQIKNAKQISKKDKQTIDKIFKDYPFLK